jgi:hypothetical protein
MRQHVRRLRARGTSWWSRNWRRPTNSGMATGTGPRHAAPDEAVATIRTFLAETAPFAHVVVDPQGGLPDRIVAVSAFVTRPETPPM